MNVDFVKEALDDILEHYDDLTRPMVRSQILVMVDFIIQEKETYIKSEEGKELVDKLLAKVINGEFL